MSTKIKVIIVASALLLTFAVGRYTAPEKVKIEKHVEYVETKTETQDKDKHKKVTITEKTNPDGSKEKTTVITDDTSTKTVSTDNLRGSETTSKEVTKSSGHLGLYPMVGVNVLSPSSGFTYGGMITRQLLGPIDMGFFGMSNGVAGVTLGLRF